MNLADYITGSAKAAQRQRVEASVPPLREGYSRTQELVDHIAEAAIAEQEAAAVELLTRRGWTCVAPEVAA